MTTLKLKDDVITPLDTLGTLKSDHFKVLRIKSDHFKL